jgi:hypothetical protein
LQQIDIDWAARVMIARHGGEAAGAAQRRVKRLLNSNEPDAAALWVRVERAIRELQGPPFPAGDEEAREIFGNNSPV